MRLDRKEKKDNFIKINTRRVYNERWKLDGIRKLALNGFLDVGNRSCEITIFVCVTSLS